MVDHQLATITTVGGREAYGCPGHGGPAVDATCKDPNGSASRPTGRFGLRQRVPQHLRKIAPDGTISTLAHAQDRLRVQRGPRRRAMSVTCRAGHTRSDADGKLYLSGVRPDHPGGQQRDHCICSLRAPLMSNLPESRDRSLLGTAEVGCSRSVQLREHRRSSQRCSTSPLSLGSDRQTAPRRVHRDVERAGGTPGERQHRCDPAVLQERRGDVVAPHASCRRAREPARPHTPSERDGRAPAVTTPRTCTRPSPSTPTDARTSSTSSRRRRRRRSLPGSCAPGNERRCPASRATSRSQDRRAPRSQAVSTSGRRASSTRRCHRERTTVRSDSRTKRHRSCRLSPIPADGNPGSRTGSSRGDRRTSAIVDEPPHERPPSSDANSAIAGWNGFWVLR